MARVEEKLAEVGATTPDKRAAPLRCRRSASPFPTAPPRLYRGEVEGTLVWPPRGTGGFGYDPMFLPTGLARTFGEITAEEKHAVSHRARAFARFVEARLGKSMGAPLGATGTTK